MNDTAYVDMITACNSAPPPGQWHEMRLTFHLHGFIIAGFSIPGVHLQVYPLFSAVPQTPAESVKLEAQSGWG